MKMLVAFVALVFCTLTACCQFQEGGSAVRHAPTLDQCRADAALWVKNDWHSLSMMKISEMQREIGDCEKVDPVETAHDYFLRYIQIDNAVMAEYTSRLQSFITRHQLYKQFADEDEAGKR